MAELMLPTPSQIKVMSRHADAPGDLGLYWHRAAFVTCPPTLVHRQFPGAELVVTAHEIRDHLAASIAEGTLTEAECWHQFPAGLTLGRGEDVRRQLTSYAASMVAIAVGTTRLQVEYRKLGRAEEKLSATAAEIVRNETPRG